MNQSRLGKGIDGVLEIILAKNSKKKQIIYASRINENGTWHYYRNNGQILARKSSLNPEQMAIALGKEYNRRNLDGEIHWRYISTQPNHIHSREISQ